MNKRGLVLSACLSLVFATSPALALSAKEIMTKNEDARRVQDLNSSATIVTGGGGREDKTKQFTWWRKLSADGVHFNTLTRFHAPAEVRGEGILFLEAKDGENEVLIYLPNFKKIRRVETQQQSGSFMGSEFSYSDIASPHVDEHEYKLVREEACPEGEAAKVKCFVIEATPVSEKVRERTGYARTLNWIRQDNFMGVKGEYFGLDGVLLKKMDASETKLVDQAKQKWMAHKIRIENVKSSRFTLLTFANVKANAGIPDSTFTQQNLSRVK